ncbi:conserved Plasmodium protein, unknown function [Plasmodium berghei]|uniref:Uncharacterized protein n=1 Tax=Plasmodium berghei TaxID=5821 RepID=A0A1C6WPN9_PLABE|nr:conserved Plasmodium protein, unknown function [Plasmodium berghei]
MAVPKKRRSLHKCRKRRNTIFFDKLVGNWLKRREWSEYQRTILPVEQEPPRFKFPGFWPNKFVYQISSNIKKILK